jgi:hypothetical protein
MTFRVYYHKRNRNGDRNGYKLPNSMSWLSDYQDSSMKYHWSPTLSNVKIFGMLIGGEEYTLPYKLFIGVMPTNRGSKIIIVGEYFRDNPSEKSSFYHIEVPDSEMIDFVCDSDLEPDSDSEPDSDRKSLDILHLQNNTYAILLKTGVIIIGITPTFQKYLDENVDYDEGNYDDSYLYVKRFNFVRDITDSPFDTPITDCHDMRIDKKMTSSVEKNDDDHSTIRLAFSCVCSCSDADCLTKSHWSTENCIWIYISNEEIRIDDSRYITTNERCVVDGEYNDRPTIRNFENDDSFHHETTYKLIFPEDKSEKDD